MGLALYERLLLLDATLKSIPPDLVHQLQAACGTSGHLLSTGVDLLAGRRFDALEFEGDDGERIAVFGRMEMRPSLSPTDRENLSAGLPLILAVRTDSVSARTFLLRRLDRLGQGPGTLIAEVSAEFLWGGLASNLPSPNTRIRVQDDSGRVLFRSTPEDLVSRSDPIVEAAPQPAPAEMAPDSVSRPFVSSALPVLLDEVFAAPTWTLVLSESEDEVLGPLARFTRLFGWAILCAGITVLLLSGSQIQRSLVPLVELREGTRRIAHRDFNSRVSVSSRDEFEELGASFNAMAGELGRQFQALSTAAEIDRAVLSAIDVAAIVDIVLLRARDVFPCHLVGVTLVAPDAGKWLTGVVYDYCDEQRHASRVELRSEDVQELLDGPDLLLVEVGEGLPAYLDPVAQLGTRSLVVLPLRFRRQLVGILLLGERGHT